MVKLRHFVTLLLLLFFSSLFTETGEMAGDCETGEANSNALPGYDCRCMGWSGEGESIGVVKLGCELPPLLREKNMAKSNQLGRTGPVCENDCMLIRCCCNCCW